MLVALVGCVTDFDWILSNGISSCFARTWFLPRGIAPASRRTTTPAECLPSHGPRSNDAQEPLNAENGSQVLDTLRCVGLVRCDRKVHLFQKGPGIPLMRPSLACALLRSLATHLGNPMIKLRTTGSAIATGLIATTVGVAVPAGGSHHRYLRQLHQPQHLWAGAL